MMDRDCEAAEVAEVTAAVAKYVKVYDFGKQKPAYSKT